MSDAFRNRLIVLLFVIGITLWFWGVNYAHVGIYNANNNYLSLAAKNYLRFGFGTLKFVPTYFAGEILPSPAPYYLHHPILIFPLSTIPFMMFGFHNWVVHVTNFLFLVGVIFLLYEIGALVWNKKVGLWAAGLAMVFPMTSFFWKYIFFEQGSLFFNLLVFYFFIRYIQVQKTIFLAYIFLFTFLSGLIDWGVLYLFLPFLVFFFSKYRKHVLLVILVYLAAAIISLSFFVGGVYFLRHGFADIVHAVQIRAVADELFSLSVWPVRLFVISVIRVGLYFTPFAVVAAWFAYKNIKLTLLFFLIFGLLNVFVLPTATWGHSYFLFYLIPFFAFSGALWIVGHEKKHGLILGWIVIIILSSIVVNYYKIQQVQKQLWQYDAALKINEHLVPYERIGVINFSGDMFENYFLHPTQSMRISDIGAWQLGGVYPEIAKIVVSFDPRGSSASLITRDSQVVVPNISPRTNSKANILLEFYRAVRDILNVGQI